MKGRPKNPNNTSQPTNNPNPTTQPSNHLNHTNHPVTHGQSTWIVNGGVIAAVLGCLTIVGHLVDMKELIRHFGISFPGEGVLKPAEYPPPEWIGTKIEHIYYKQLPGYRAETTLVDTDKPGGDNLVLRNIDQDLSVIGRVHKNNSGDYAVHLRRLKENKSPACLEVYGIRKPGNNEFKNVIQINNWSSKKNYDSLSPEERDEECKKNKDLPLTIIVHPRS